MTWGNSAASYIKAFIPVLLAGALVLPSAQAPSKGGPGPTCQQWLHSLRALFQWQQCPSSPDGLWPPVTPAGACQLTGGKRLEQLGGWEERGPWHLARDPGLPLPVPRPLCSSSVSTSVLFALFLWVLFLRFCRPASRGPQVLAKLVTQSQWLKTELLSLTGCDFMQQVT